MSWLGADHAQCDILETPKSFSRHAGRLLAKIDEAVDMKWCRTTDLRIEVCEIGLQHD